MKKFTFNKKYKIIGIIFLIIVLVPSIIGVLLIFSNSNVNNKTNINNDYELNEFNNISVYKYINKNSLKDLLKNNNSNEMSKTNIEKNLGKIIKNAFSNSNEFKNENIDDYNLKIRYKINDQENDLKINIFLYNKLIKNKKYKSSFRIYII